MNNPHLSVIGAGIVGLMVAREATRRWPDVQVTVFDEGPDPRQQPGFAHTFGATYSGLDARHVSLTETGPWTSSSRIDLITEPPSADGGWNCLADVELSETEARWLREFRTIAE